MPPSELSRTSRRSRPRRWLDRADDRRLHLVDVDAADGRCRAVVCLVGSCAGDRLRRRAPRRASSRARRTQPPIGRSRSRMQRKRLPCPARGVRGRRRGTGDRRVRLVDVDRGDDRGVGVAGVVLGVPGDRLTGPFSGEQCNRRDKDATPERLSPQEKETRDVYVVTAEAVREQESESRVIVGSVASRLIDDADRARTRKKR